MRPQKGFSLIELLIVVAIILVIAAIAIPSFLHSKMAANETSAVASLRSINTAQVTYAANYPSLGYATLLPSLGGTSCTTPTPAASCMLDDALANSLTAASPKSGYYFTLGGTNAAPTSSYTVTGLPARLGTTGQRGFFTDQTYVVRYTTDGSAPTNISPPIQ